MSAGLVTPRRLEEQLQRAFAQVGSEIQQLADALAAVAARQSEQNEALVPNYLTFDPATGRVGAKFSGVISAQGVTLPESTVQNPPPTSIVNWTDPSTGVTAGEIYTQSRTTQPFPIELILQAFGEVIAGPTTRTAGIDILARATDLAPVLNSAVSAFAGTLAVRQSVTLVDDAGNSSFLILSVPLGQHLVNFGQFGPFTRAANTQVAIPHGLGVTPAAFFVLPDFAGGNGFYYSNTPPGNVNLFPACSGAVTNANLYWLAVS